MSTRPELLLHVIEALADADGVSPHDLDYSLYDYVETDALRLLDTSNRTDWTLTFHVPDHEVEVHGDGRILVDGELLREVGGEPVEEVP
ncbi:MAG: HalOD1 output domain-containing protein [Halolamina sp.]